MNKTTEVLFSGVHSDRAGWLKAREGRIGASEIATVCGLNPYKGRLQLWQEMTGKIDRADLSNNDHVWLGTELEPVVAKLYSKKTGKELVRCDQMYGRSDISWAECTPDYFGPDNDLLEIKTAGSYAADEWSNQIPRHLHLQVQFQLGIMGLPTAVIACLLGGRDLVWHPVTFEGDIFDQLIGMGESFMDNVQKDIPPIATSSDMGLLPLPNPEAPTMILDERFRNDVQDYLSVKLRIAGYKGLAKDQETELETIKARLRQAMGEAPFARLGNFKLESKIRTRKSFVSAESSWVEFKIKEEEVSDE